MVKAGFIMLYRELIEWEWYTDVNTCKLFLHCLLKTNFSQKRWQGITIDKDEFVTSYERLAVETGLTVSKVRTALTKLEKSENISIETTSSFTKVIVLNMKDFVSESRTEQISMQSGLQINEGMTYNSQADSNQFATTNTKNSNITNRKKIFREEVFSHTMFDIKILEGFFNHWSELNADKTKMRKEDEAYFELVKRLKKWAANERQSKQHNIPKATIISNR